MPLSDAPISKAKGIDRGLCCFLVNLERHASCRLVNCVSRVSRKQEGKQKTPREEAKEEKMKTIVAAAISLMVAVSLTPAPSLAQSMRAGGSHTVLALLDDQDVQGARENQDLQSPRENQDLQSPRENQDLQSPRENQDMQSPRENQDLQSPRENQDLQSPRANQDLQSPRENQDLQSPRANQDLQSPRAETLSPASAVSR
jgi:hypothetical protein